MKKAIISLLFFAVSFSVSAEPEIKGTPEDLRQFLHPKENIVSIKGEAEEKNKGHTNNLLTRFHDFNMD